MFKGKKASGCEVTSSTVYSSITLAERSVGMREVVAPT